MVEGAEACEVGEGALLLASDYTIAITGEVLHVDRSFRVEVTAFH